jgi:hypothetical protein
MASDVFAGAVSAESSAVALRAMADRSAAAATLKDESLIEIFFLDAARFISSVEVMAADALLPSRERTTNVRANCWVVSMLLSFVLTGGERLVFFVDPLLRAAKVHGFKRHFMR